MPRNWSRTSEAVQVEHEFRAGDAAGFITQVNPLARHFPYGAYAPHKTHSCSVLAAYLVQAYLVQVNAASNLEKISSRERRLRCSDGLPFYTEE
jgi:hypothetical protein